MLYGEKQQLLLAYLMWLGKKKRHTWSHHLFSDLKNNLHACGKCLSYAAVSYHTVFPALKCMNKCIWSDE